MLAIWANELILVIEVKNLQRDYGLLNTLSGNIFYDFGERENYMIYFI